METEFKPIVIRNPPPNQDVRYKAVNFREPTLRLANIAMENPSFLDVLPFIGKGRLPLPC